MALPQNGITISLVRNTLSETTNDLGRLCTSNRINPNSFYKPITTNKLNVTYDDFVAANDGFTIQTYDNAIDCWNAYVNGETWVYNPVNPPYRLGDFRGYDHYAGAWLNLDFMDNSQAKKGEIRLIENNGSMDFESVYYRFPYYAPIQNPGGQDIACIGLLLNPNWTGNEQSVYFYRIRSLLDFDNERLPFTVPSDLGSYDRIWHFIPVISTYMRTSDGSCSYHSKANPDMATSTWFALPCDFFSLYLKNEQWVPTPDFTLNVDIPWIDFNYGSNEITELQGDITYTINSAKYYDISVNSTIYYDNATSPVAVANVVGTITAGSTTLTKHWAHGEYVITVAADLKDEDQLPFRVVTTYSYSGQSFSKTDYLIGYKQ